MTKFCRIYQVEHPDIDINPDGVISIFRFLFNSLIYTIFCISGMRCLFNMKIGPGRDCLNYQKPIINVIIVKCDSIFEFSTFFTNMKHFKALIPEGNVKKLKFILKRFFLHNPKGESRNHELTSYR